MCHFHTQRTYARGGPLEQEGLSPTVRLYSRISMVSHWSCFWGTDFRLIFFLPCKLSSCVNTVMALFLGLDTLQETAFDETILVLLAKRTLYRWVVSMAESEPTDAIVSVSISFHIQHVRVLSRTIFLLLLLFRELSGYSRLYDLFLWR